MPKPFDWSNQTEQPDSDIGLISFDETNRRLATGFMLDQALTWPDETAAETVVAVNRALQTALLITARELIGIVPIQFNATVEQSTDGNWHLTIAPDSTVKGKFNVDLQYNPVQGATGDKGDKGDKGDSVFPDVTSSPPTPDAGNVQCNIAEGVAAWINSKYTDFLNDLSTGATLIDGLSAFIGSLGTEETAGAAAFVTMINSIKNVALSALIGYNNTEWKAQVKCDMLCALGTSDVLTDSIIADWKATMATHTDIVPSPFIDIAVAFLSGFTNATYRKWAYIYSQKEGFCNDCPGCGGTWNYAWSWRGGSNPGNGNWHVSGAGWFADNGGGYWGNAPASNRQLTLYLQWDTARQIDSIDIDFVAAGGSIVPPPSGSSSPVENHNAQGRAAGESSFGTRYANFTADNTVTNGSTITISNLGWTNVTYLPIRLGGYGTGELAIKAITIHGSGGGLPTFS